MKRTFLVPLVVVALAVASAGTVFAATKTSTPSNGTVVGQSIRVVNYLSNILAASNADTDQGVIELKNPRFSQDAVNGAVSFVVSFTCGIADSAEFGFDTSMDNKVWHTEHARGLTTGAVAQGAIKSLNFDHYFRFLRANFSTADAGSATVIVTYPIE